MGSTGRAQLGDGGNHRANSIYAAILPGTPACTGRAMTPQAMKHPTRLRRASDTPGIGAEGL